MSYIYYSLPILQPTKNYCQAIDGVKMKRKIRINPKTKLAYIPEELINEGFVGDLDAYANAKTLTIAHPGASLDDVERSLEIVLLDIRLRMGKIGSGSEKLS